MSAGRLSLPIAEWPARWRALWEAATAVGDGLDPDGRASGWAPDTRREIRKRLEYFFCFLSRRGRLSGLPADYLRREALGAYLAHLRQRGLRPATIDGYLRDVMEGVRAMQPEADLRTINVGVRRLQSFSRRAGKRPRPFVEPKALYEAGLARMERVAGEAYEKADVKAVQYGDGLLMAIAACALDRRRNLANIVIGRNLIRDGERYMLQFEPHQTKGRKHHSADLPVRLTPCIETYLAQHRAKLLQGGDSDVLFVSCYRRPMSAQTLYIRFRACTLEELGVELTPHDVRSLAVTDLVEKHPELVTMAPDLLHHSSAATTHDHYLRARQKVMNRRFLRELIEAQDEAGAALDEGGLFPKGG